MPISRVRLPTAWATAAYNPTSASSNPAALSDPTSTAAMRMGNTPPATASASGRTSNAARGSTSAMAFRSGAIHCPGSPATRTSTAPNVSGTYTAATFSSPNVRSLASAASPTTWTAWPMRWRVRPTGSASPKSRRARVRLMTATPESPTRKSRPRRIGMRIVSK